ncbi:hypothetical protein MKW94_011750 [Papaver nudicaule]|uniref:Uncharacterized protein n=1 Tax=Papaver nudicaule TaxID=74823 RepID=A0AA41S4F9_PAPNU|nr:hypothetical protein [Papaver nudicaule]
MLLLQGNLVLIEKVTYAEWVPVFQKLFFTLLRTMCGKRSWKNKALKAQLDAERQKNSREGRDRISSSSYQQQSTNLISCNTGYWDLSAPPSSFGLSCLRNFKRKAVACEYVDRAKPPNDDDYDCMINEIMDSRAILCDKDGVLGDVLEGAMIKWQKAYGTAIGEPLN